MHNKVLVISSDPDLALPLFEGLVDQDIKKDAEKWKIYSLVARNVRFVLINPDDSKDLEQIFDVGRAHISVRNNVSSIIYVTNSKDDGFYSTIKSYFGKITPILPVVTSEVKSIWENREPVAYTVENVEDINTWLDEHSFVPSKHPKRSILWIIVLFIAFVYSAINTGMFMYCTQSVPGLIVPIYSTCLGCISVFCVSLMMAMCCIF